MKNKNSLCSYYKVPFRQVYCETFRGWLASCILCHVVYRLNPPHLPKLPAVAAILLASLCIFCTNSFAQTNAQPSAVPTVQSGVQTIVDALKTGQSNWYVIPYALYAPGLQKHAGGGVAAVYPLSDYIVTGIRLDYVNGNFWMPSGNATFQVPVKLTKWLTVTPFTYAGIGVPVSGAHVAGVVLPGQTPRDNNGQATAILGYGGAIDICDKVWIFKNLKLVGDVEKWTGFPGSQYRLGISGKF